MCTKDKLSCERNIEMAMFQHGLYCNPSLQEGSKQAWKVKGRDTGKGRDKLTMIFINVTLRLSTNGGIRLIFASLNDFK